MADPQLITCPNCGANNRVPLEKIQKGLEPICGRCKKRLLISNGPVIVTELRFRLRWSAGNCRCWLISGHHGAVPAGWSLP
jgi:DNA-directed RNA polymerase subunit RPC12/RpoP